MQTAASSRWQVFVHWLVANAAGGGVLTGLWELLRYGDERNVIPPEGTGLLLLLLELAAILLILYAQELILAAGGLPSPFWVVSTIGGVMFGGVAALFVGLMIGIVAMISNSEALAVIAAILSVFTGGMVIGAVQTTGLSRPLSAHLTWMLAHGLVLFPLVFLSAYLYSPFANGPFHSSAALYGTLLGGVYGLVTGGCLVWLLPRTPADAERNRRNAQIAARDMAGTNEW